MNADKFISKAYDWILEHGPSVLLAIVLFIIGQWLIKLIKKGLRSSMHKREFDPSLQPFFHSLIVTVLQALLLLAIMQILGIQMTIFAAVIGAAGVAAGLALSGTLQNFAGGVLILLLKPFRVGENIFAQGQEGKVTAIQIFYTVVTTFDNKTVIIPNGKLSNEVIINISRQGKRRLDVEMKFSFANDIAEVKRIMNESIRSNREILEDPAFRIGVSAIETDGFKLMMNVWVDAYQFVDFKFAFQEKLVHDLKAAGIKLPGM